ncbi:hypothetical protein [Dehalobacterium formicoaceticum]|uniref:Uncharacterized protein n=1 Tax=Dehalobacterium formicoaceticum TaxID=51515 RepID=A0ABT1Y7M6_9FIRM|nr:hypothetical protein [Dehalobacterium formicoaceticum]MCR6546085.1 hypothetical protein [Dehalobacterium formicoaceticum]
MPIIDDFEGQIVPVMKKIPQAMPGVFLVLSYFHLFLYRVAVDVLIASHQGIVHLGFCCQGNQGDGSYGSQVS